MATTPTTRSWCARVDARVVAALRPLARLVARFHDVRLDGIEHLPDGPALLIGNHGLLGYETLAFFHAVLERTGRLPLGLADRWFFRVPGLRSVLVRAGGMLGTPENARAALASGAWVVAYPGGAREVLKRHNRVKYRLQWERSLGFARLASALGIPVVPFAAAGVDDTFDVVTTLRGSGRLLMRHAKYDLPVLWGRGPLPRPVPFWFRFGPPIAPARRPDALHAHAWRTTQRMLDELHREWKARDLAPAGGAP
jgi:1-acyl-sn-glycerol-3-phosphate acyltransferase